MMFDHQDLAAVHTVASFSTERHYIYFFEHCSEKEFAFENTCTQQFRDVVYFILVQEENSSSLDPAISRFFHLKIFITTEIMKRMQMRRCATARVLVLANGPARRSRSLSYRNDDRRR